MGFIYLFVYLLSLISVSHDIKDGNENCSMVFHRIFFSKEGILFVLSTVTQEIEEHLPFRNGQYGKEPMLFQILATLFQIILSMFLQIMDL